MFRIKSKKNANPDTNGAGDYAVIVTAYEDLSLIHAVVDSILKVDYGNFIIYIVADNCDVSTLNFADERIVVLRPTEVLSSNVKSHFYAINNFKRQHDRITIIDSDNLVQSSYFVELNHIFDLGYHAVQGVREAKNLNTSLACLDAANDIYYRYADKELLTLAGSSASLSGSGMAFSTELYKECMLKLDASGAGFDKILQYEIVIRKLKIAFAKKAIVYDEKTSKSDQLVKQRARWINTWFKFFKLGLKMMLSGVVNRDWNQFLFSIMLVRPPLFILLFLSLLWFAIGLLIVPELSLIIVISSFIFVFTFMKSLSHFKADRRIYQSLKRIPIFIFFQVQALLKAKKANKLSVATKHDHNTTINDLD
ncbi:glycosyltransferase family 2 protein [Pedobacter heparinus]|uniref:glycosyltransferase family 2 protein n=1 Tax=Pedobacter heparinus TaxID=984 RepID=UPI001FD15226|nr:glycosyltransferase family 2 protein [Pedobacter heparinus]